MTLDELTAVICRELTARTIDDALETFGDPEQAAASLRDRIAQEVLEALETKASSLGGHGVKSVPALSTPSFESPSKAGLVVSHPVRGESRTMVAGNGTLPIRPTYYVKHPDGSYSESELDR